MHACSESEPLTAGGGSHDAAHSERSQPRTSFVGGERECTRESSQPETQRRYQHVRAHAHYVPTVLNYIEEHCASSFTQACTAQSAVELVHRCQSLKCDTIVYASLILAVLLLRYFSETYGRFLFCGSKEQWCCMRASARRNRVEHDAPSRCVPVHPLGRPPRPLAPCCAALAVGLPAVCGSRTAAPRQQRRVRPSDDACCHSTLDATMCLQSPPRSDRSASGRASMHTAGGLCAEERRPCMH